MSPIRRWPMTGTGIWSRPTAWWRRCSPAFRSGCSASPSTCCGLPSTPRRWRRARSISRNGAAHLLERLHRQCEATADPELIKLYNDLKSYPIPARAAPLSSDNVAIPFKLRHDGEILSFFSTTMVFGTPVDITLSELALETFFPADERTAERLRQMAAAMS